LIDLLKAIETCTTIINAIARLIIVAIKSTYDLTSQ
jgi:hypothetical protein